MPLRHRTPAVLIVLALALGLACDTSGPPDPERFTLTVTLAGDGAGTVTATPGGLSCATEDVECSVEVVEGTTISLTAGPGAGDAFAGWDGPCGSAGTGACDLVVDGDVAVTAEFDNPDRTGSMIGAAGGTVTSVDGTLVLTIPAGALAEETEITVETLEESELGSEWADVLAAGPAGASYRLGPDGTVFDVPALVEVSVPGAGEDLSTVAAELLLTYEDGQVTVLDSIVYLPGRGDSLGVASARLHHFSPLVRTNYGGAFTGRLTGVPEEAFVGEHFDASVAVSVAGFVADLSMYRIYLGPGPNSVFHPGHFSIYDLPAVGVNEFAGTNEWACGSEGPGLVGVLVGVRIAPDQDGVIEVPPARVFFRGPEIYLEKRPVQCYAQPSLLVEVLGSGEGRVTSPEGIACTSAGGTCVLDLPLGTGVTLTATPEAGSTFEGWSSDGSGTGSQTVVTMDGHRTVTAVFEPVEHEVGIVLEGPGTGSVTSEPAGLECTKDDPAAGAECSASFAEGTEIFITPTPDAGTEVGEWTGCDAVVEDICQISSRPEVQVHLNYTLNLNTLTVTKSGDGTGTVVSLEDNPGEKRINCGLDCSFDWDLSDVTLVARPDAGSLFTGWSGDCAGTDTVAVVHMDQPRTCDAEFSVDPELTLYTLTAIVDVLSGPGGRVTSTTGSSSLLRLAAGGGGSTIDCTQDGGTCTLTGPAGQVIRMSAHPEPGAYLYGWYRAGVTDPETGDRLITLTADTTSIAVFNPIPLEIDSVRVQGSEANEAPQGGEIVLEIYGEGLLDIDSAGTYLDGIRGVILMESPDSARIRFAIGHGTSALGPATLQVRSGGGTRSIQAAITVTPIAVSPDGNDSHTGSTSAPFLTLARAVEVSAAGDSILLSAGEYAVAGTDGVDLSGRVLRGAGSALSIIRGPGSGIGLDYSTTTTNTIRGVTVTGFGTGIRGEGVTLLLYDVASQLNSEVAVSGSSVYAQGIDLGGSPLGFSGGGLEGIGGSISGNGTGVAASGSVTLTSVVMDSNGVAILATGAAVLLDTVTIPTYTDSVAILTTGGSLSMANSEVGAGTGWGIRATGTYLTLTGSAVRQSVLGGIFSTDNTVTITDTEVTENGTGLRLLSTVAGTHDASITGSRFSNGTGTGIEVLVNGQVTLNDSWVEENDGAGIHVDYVGTLVLSGDTIRGNGGAGVDYDAVSGLVASGGAIADNGDHGIRLRVSHPDLVGVYYPSVDLYGVALHGNAGFQLSNEIPAGSPYVVSASGLDWGGITGPTGLKTGPDSQTEGMVDVWRIVEAGNQIQFDG